MYVPKHFTVAETEPLIELIREAPLGTLIVNGPEGLDASHIPFIYEADDNGLGRLRAHIPRFNPLSDVLKATTDCLVVFHGPEGYMTPSWYATKQAHGRVVPTWNYAVTHVHGTANAVDDADWVLDQINALTNQNEASREEHWSVSDAPESYINGMLKSLVGVEVSIVRINGKIKASQNQPAQNKASILAALDEEQPDSALTGLMRKVLDEAE